MKRLLLLTRIIEDNSPLKGERILQKIVYLIQSQGTALGYCFAWKNYGPFSLKLANDIRELEAIGLIKIKIMNGISEYSTEGMRSRVSRYWIDKYDKLTLIDVKMGHISEILKITENNPLSLEIIASLDFLGKESTSDPVDSLITRTSGRISRNEIKRVQNLSV